ncbi:MAG: toxin-antitoxin system HicB family antitoxin [Planctomycetaceae bacterium]|nr:toxin-antitoxin system HicB family antitoxin [Planctomycetaceae bacterium]
MTSIKSSSFKDNRTTQTKLEPRPRYYDQHGNAILAPVSNVQTLPSRESDSCGSDNPISVKQRRQAVQKALAMSWETNDWEDFFREIMSMQGLIHQMFPSVTQRREFETTPEYVEIQHMMAEMRGRRKKRHQDREKTRVITVRLPESLHASLQHEAEQLNTSMNKLCISKLLQIIDKQLVQ